MSLFEVCLAVYVLLGLRGLVSFVKYCRQDEGFVMNPTTIIGFWVGWSWARYEFDYDDSELPEFEGFFFTVPFLVPLNEAINIGVALFAQKTSRLVVSQEDDTHWSRIREDDVK